MSADDGSPALGVAHPPPPRAAPTARPGGGRHALAGGVGQARARSTSASRTPSRISVAPADDHPVDVRRVHAPDHRADRVVDGEDVRAVGAEHDDVGLHARLERPGDAAEPGDPGAVDGGVADHVARAHQPGEPGLAGELAVEDRRVLERDRLPHLGEHVAGRDAFVVDRRAPGRMSRSMSCWIGGGAEPARHLARRAPGDTHAPEAAIASSVGAVEPAAVHERDVVAEQPAAAGEAAGDRSSPRSAVGVDPQPELARPRPVERHAVGIAGGRPTDPNATVVEGPAAATRREISAGSVGGTGSPLPRRGGPRDEHRAQPGVRVRLQRGLGAASSVRTSAQSTTVVIPASTAPSSADQGGGVDVVGRVVVAEARRGRRRRSGMLAPGCGTATARRDGGCRRTRASRSCRWRRPPRRRGRGGPARPRRSVSPSIRTSACGEVRRLRPEGEDASAAQEEPGSRAAPASTDLKTVS